MGVEVPEPVINDLSRELNFTNEIGYGGSVRLLKNLAGLWIVQECRRCWAEKEEDLDYDVMTHLAASSPPFESLINPADPRFLDPGDMPAQIPVGIGPAEATAAGNVLVQALALGHVASLDQARKIVRDSFNMEIIQPHAAAWIAAFERLERLFGKA